MNPECREIRKAILLGAGEDPGSRAHLERCEACRRVHASEKVTAELVRAHAPQTNAPATLREWAADTFEPGATAARRHARLRRRAVWWGVAALLLLCVAGGAWYADYRGRGKAHDTIELLAQDYIEYALRSDRAEFVSSSAREVEKWLRSRVRLAVAVPDLPDTRLLGARYCDLAGRPAALIFYALRAQGRPDETIVSVFAFEGGGEDWSGMETLPVPGKRRICHAHEKGVRIVVWERLGLTYALASQLEEGSITALASTL